MKDMFNLLINVHIALVEEMMKYIDGIHSGGSLLLATKDQVDPLKEEINVLDY